MTNPLEKQLPKIRRNAHDPEWLDRNEGDLLHLLKENPQAYMIQDAVKIITLVAPHYLKRPNHAEWEKQVWKILRSVEEIKDYNSAAFLQRQLGYARIVGERPKVAAVNMRHHAENVFQNSQDPSQHLEAFIGLIQAYIFYPDKKAGTQIIDETLDALESEPEDSTLRALAYQSIATYYQVRADDNKAAEYAHLAKNIWEHRLENVRYERNRIAYETGLGKALLMIAIAERGNHNLEQARETLNQAAEYLSRSTYPHDFMICKWELSVIERKTGNPEHALELAEEVFEYFENMDYATHAGLALYTSGRALTELGRYAEAIAHLERSLDEYWKMTKNTSYELYTRVALALAHARQAHDDIHTDAATENDYKEARSQLKQVQTQMDSMKLMDATYDDLLEEIESVRRYLP